MTVPARWETYAKICTLKEGQSIDFDYEEMRELCRMNQTGFDLMAYMSPNSVTESLKEWRFFSQYMLHFDPMTTVWTVHRPKNHRPVMRAARLSDGEQGALCRCGRTIIGTDSMAVHFE